MNLKFRGSFCNIYHRKNTTGCPVVLYSIQLRQVLDLLKEHIFDNNLTLIYERLEHMRSVSLGVWIGAGSRYETAINNGISHFIEHMLFKETKRRTSKEIAGDIDKIGGQINAFTGKDCTCFYASTLDTDIEIAVDVLSDMLFNSIFDPGHIENEKKVILEEIKMYEDDPEELVHDILTEEMWNGCSLGYPILGTQKSLKNIKRDMMLEYMADYYIPDNCVISVVGSFEENRLIDMIQRYFGSWKPLNYCRFSYDKPYFRSKFVYKEKDIEQTHLCIGFKGLSMSDRGIYPLFILNNIIGGSMSSKLFQTIREEMGLAYSIYSFPTMFRDCGMFTIYAATNHDKAEQVIEKIRQEINALLKDGLTDEEFTRSKNQLKGNYILGLDSTIARMSSIGKAKVITGVVKTTKETLAEIDSVKKDDVMEAAFRVFDPKCTGLAIIGQTSVTEACLDYFMF